MTKVAKTSSRIACMITAVALSWAFPEAPAQSMRLASSQAVVAPIQNLQGVYLAADSSGNIFALDSYAQKVSELSPSGGGYKVTQLFTMTDVAYACGLAADNFHIVRAIDCGNGYVYEYDLTTGVTTKRTATFFTRIYTSAMGGDENGYIWQGLRDTQFFVLTRYLGSIDYYHGSYAFSNNYYVEDKQIDHITSDRNGSIYFLSSSVNSNSSFPRTVWKLTPTGGNPETMDYIQKGITTVADAQNGFAVATDGTLFYQAYGQGNITMVTVDSAGNNPVASTIGSGLTGTYTTNPSTGNALAVDPLKSVFTVDNKNIIKITPSATSAPFLATSVGASSTIQLTYAFGAATTINKVVVTADGATTTEFTAGTTGCIAGATIAAAGTCTLTMTFTPQAPGWRRGAITFLDSTGTVLASTELSGQGMGPQLVATPAIPVSIGSGMNAPRKMAVDGAGNIYIADTANNRILLQTKTAPRVYSQSVLATGFNKPVGIGVDGAGNVFVADQGSQSLIELKRKTDGTYTRVIVDNQFPAATDLVVDLAGAVYVSDSTNRFVVKETPNGAGGFTARTLSISAHAFGAIAVDSNFNLYTTSSVNSQVYKEILQPNGSYLEIVYYNGANVPQGLAIDRFDNLYISDTGNNRVLRIDANDGSSSVVQSGLNAPWDAISDKLGNLYILQTGANTLQMLDYNSVPPSMAFADTSVGATSLQVAHVLNLGNLPLTYTSIATATTSFSPTTYSTPCATTTPLAVNGDCWLGVNFTPKTISTVSDNLTLKYTSTAGPTLTTTIPLTGNGQKANQTINFPTPAPGAVGSTATLSATASSGLAVTFSIVTGGTGTATISGNQITYTTLGTVRIQAAQAGNANYFGVSTIAEVTVGGAPTLVGTTSSVGTLTFYNPYTSTVARLGTPAAIALTQGVNGADFKIAPGGSCADGGTVSPRGSCTVNYTFTPSSPGERLGVIYTTGTNVSLSSAAYVSSAQINISGLGVGPLAIFSQFPQSTTIASNLTTGTGLTVDAFGNVYVSNAGAKTVLKYAAGSTTPVKLADLSATSGITYTTGTALEGSGHLFFGTNTGLNFVNTDGSGRTALQLYVLNSNFSTSQVIVNVDNSLTLDGASNLYFSDVSTGAIYKVNTDTLLSSGGPTVTPLLAGGANHRFVGMVADPNGNLFAADYTNNILYELVAGASSLTTLYNGPALKAPHSITIDVAGNLYVANSTDSTIYRFPAGNYGSPTLLTATGTRSVAIGPDGSLYSVQGATTLVRYARSNQSASFATTQVGSQSASTSYTLENIGNSTLNITSVAASSTDFTVAPTGTCKAGVAVGINGTCTVGASFSPQRGGALTGAVNVTDNSFTGAGSVQTINLTGTATALPTALALGGTPFNGDVSQPLTLTATLSPNATSSVTAGGTVTFKSGSTTLSTVPLTGGVATYTLPTPPPGVSSYTATYSGDTTFQASTSDVFANTVSKLSTALTLSLNPTPSNSSQSTTLTATLLPSTVAAFTANGQTITFLNGATVLGTATLTAGIASITTTLPIGSASITAVYAGDTNFTSTTSAAVSLNVRGVSLFIANTGGSITSYYTTGVMQSSATQGGGIGAAVDSNGNVWSIQANGNGLAVFQNTGTALSTYSPTGITAGKALAVDGNNVVWVANADGSVVAVASGGTASAAIIPGGVTSTPASISVDTAGSLWIATPSANTVTEVIGAAGPIAAPTVTQTLSAAPGVKP